VGNWLGIESFKINLPMIAALMTLVGYSVNDTIVVFDRIREIRRKSQPITWGIINAAVNQTLSRTILTGFTTWIVALILYGFGGAAIHSFAFCLLSGILVGTYSSVYIASPILVWFAPAAGRRPHEPKTGDLVGKPAMAPEEVPSGQQPNHQKNRKGRKKKAA
jgi:SecD/SecF fusion protein